MYSIKQVKTYSITNKRHTLTRGPSYLYVLWRIRISLVYSSYCFSSSIPPWWSLILVIMYCRCTAARIYTECFLKMVSWNRRYWGDQRFLTHSITRSLTQFLTHSSLNHCLKDSLSLTPSHRYKLKPSVWFRRRQNWKRSERRNVSFLFADDDPMSLDRCWLDRCHIEWVLESARHFAFLSPLFFHYSSFATSFSLPFSRSHRFGAFAETFFDLAIRPDCAREARRTVNNLDRTRFRGLTTIAPLRHKIRSGVDFAREDSAPQVLAA